MKAQDRFSTPTKDLNFHKNIDLGMKGQTSSTEQGPLSTTAANSLIKVPSVTSISSTFKNSFLSSLASPSRFKPLEKNTNCVPQVSIAELIKKKAHLYHDETLAVNFDDVLENGYSLVLKKKHQRTLLKQHEEGLRVESIALEKEIFPEMNKLFANKEKVKYLRGIRDKYDDEIEEANVANEDLEDVIKRRKQEVEGLGADHLKKIKELELLTTTLKNEFANNKIIHKNELYNINQTIKQNGAIHQKYLDELAKIKGECEKMRNAKVERKRKMENKAKMFLGILKH